MKGHFEARGYQSFVSPDGLNWRRYSAQPLTPGSDVITGYYDENQGLYVAFPRRLTPVRGHERRVFFTMTSPDFDHWSEPVQSWTPDARDDASTLRRIEEVRAELSVPDNPAIMRTEFYGISVHVAESCTLGFPWVFSINNTAAASKEGNQEGPGEIQFAVSRDLDNWERPFRTPMIPHGEAGEWDSGFLNAQSRAICVGDEVWLYYLGGNYTHGNRCLYDPEYSGRGTEYTGSIGIAKWQRDRFVSVDALASAGTLTTIPITFNGDRLEINARIKGDLRVEILDAAGKSLGAVSDALHGDDLRHIVTWSGSTHVARYKGQPISLKFHLREAQLFAFTFRV